MSTQICTGTFTNVASTPFYIPLEQYVSEFRLYNLTQSDMTIGSVAGSTAGSRIVEAYWNPYIPQNTARVGVVGTFGTPTASVAPLSVGNLAQNGIRIFNATNPILSAVFSISAFTPGTTTVFTTTTNHGFQVGDNVRIWNMTSAPQFGGLLMTVTATNGSNQFTTLLDSTGATTSVGSVQRVGNYLVPNSSLYYPQNRVIAKITSANPMVVTTLVQQNYFVGDVVTFDIPSLFGMNQLTNRYSGLPFQATVIAANNAVGTQTVTLAVDSTLFSAWVPTNSQHWPLAASYPFTFPVMVPQGEGNINNFQLFGVTPAPLPYANQDVLSFARQNQGFNGVLIGAGDGTAVVTTGGIIGSTVDVWSWEAITTTQSFP